MNECFPEVVTAMRVSIEEAGSAEQMISANIAAEGDPFDADYQYVSSPEDRLTAVMDLLEMSIESGPEIFEKWFAGCFLAAKLRRSASMCAACHS
eukprot:8381326-Lingulodinium_polyedra.AAC.1